MTAIEALPGLAVFQGAIMKDCVKSALESRDIENMRSHVRQIENQLGEFLRHASRAAAEQNGKPMPAE